MCIQTVIVVYFLFLYIIANSMNCNIALTNGPIDLPMLDKPDESIKKLHCH